VKRRVIMKNIRFCVAVILCGALAAISGCSDDDVTAPKGNEPILDGPATLEKRIQRTNEFALDLYRQLNASEGNLIISPHSIVTAFGMAYAGARGVTEREMAQALHFNYPPAGFHSVLKCLNDLLESRGASGGPDALRLHIANSAWGREGMTYLPAYLDTIATCYGANLRYLDFGGQPEESRITINQWVKDETEGLVKDLIPGGGITPATVLVLANAIYFRASWLYQFDPIYTQTWQFTRLDGSLVGVREMGGVGLFPYYDAVGHTAVALPYEGEECSMVVILPDEGNFESFEAALTPAKVDTILDGLGLLPGSRAGEACGGVYLPKFSFATGYDLIPTLQEMGMRTAFSPGADFWGIDGTDDGSPWIDFVAHKAVISVNEYGTLAAAGTALGFTVGEIKVFYVLRPFIFAIVDHGTGTILFLGRVLDPSIH
jgi:serpin B